MRGLLPLLLLIAVIALWLLRGEVATVPEAMDPGSGEAEETMPTRDVALATRASPHPPHGAEPREGASTAIANVRTSAQVASGDDQPWVGARVRVRVVAAPGQELPGHGTLYALPAGPDRHAVQDPYDEMDELVPTADWRKDEGGLLLLPRRRHMARGDCHQSGRGVGSLRNGRRGGRE